MNVNCVQRARPSAATRPAVNVGVRRGGPSSWLLLAAIGLLGWGCSSAGRVDSDCYSMGPSRADTPLELITWWKTDEPCKAGGEACAAQSLVDTHAICTGGAVEFNRQDTKEDTVTAVSNVKTVRDGAIINGGVDVYRLAGCTPGNKRSLSSLGPIDEPVAKFLTERTPESLRHLVTCNGEWFGAILGLHRLNQLFYDHARLSAADVSQALAERGIFLDDEKPMNLSSLKPLLEEVNRFYPRPLVIPDDNASWSRFVIENLMVAKGLEQAPNLHGQDAYTAFWAGLSEKTTEGTRSINLSTLNATLDLAVELAPFIRRGTGATASSLLGTGPSAIGEAPPVFTVAGDWEVPTLTPGLAVRPFPGTDDHYVYSSDVVVVTQPTPTLAANHPMVDLLRAFTSNQSLHPFSQLKHSLSPDTFDGDFTRAKSEETLFEVEGRKLTGISSLHSYVPHETFDNLGGNVADYMKCLVKRSETDPVGYAETCSGARAVLTDYVYEQYCEVVRRGTTDNCKPRDGRWDHLR